MAKKKSRNSRTSRGVVGSPQKARTSTGVQRALNQLEAWAAGKNVTLTVLNRDETETNRKRIRVAAKEVWGRSPAFRNRDAD